MPKNFTVTLFGEVTIRVKDVEAATPAQAFQLATEIASDSGLRRKLRHDKPTPEIPWTDYDGDNMGGIVDHPDDDEYQLTLTFNEWGRIQPYVPMLCHTYPELHQAAQALEVVKIDLGDDWLKRRIEAAQAEIAEISQVLKLRENENNDD